ATKVFSRARDPRSFPGASRGGCRSPSRIFFSGAGSRGGLPTASWKAQRSRALKATRKAAPADSPITAASVKGSSISRYRRTIDPAKSACTHASQTSFLRMRAEKIRDHGDDDDDDLSRRLGILEAADAFVQRLADPAGADDAERRRRADVGCEPVKRQRAPQRQDLGYDAEHHLLHAARAGRADAFDRSRIDGLDRFGKQLREHPEIVNENGHDAGEGAETDGHDEHQR